MSNTKVTIEYANGNTRVFEASDALEELINEGCMFSVSTMHSDLHVEEEIKLSKMYAGNPLAGLGYVVTMLSNARKVRDELENIDDEGDEVPVINEIINVLQTLLTALTGEFSSHQSGISEINGVLYKDDPEES